MKNHLILILIAVLLGSFSIDARCQTFGTSASAIWISDCVQSNFYNTTGIPGNQIGPATNAFNNNLFGVHSQYSGTLIFRGAQVKTFKAPAVANVCKVDMYYRVYPAAGVPGPFSLMALTVMDNCNTGTGQFASGGNCIPGDQKWQLLLADGTTNPYEPIDLTNNAPGNYVLEVYYETMGSSTSTSLCDETITLNNSGANYKAYFTIQAPMLVSNNPTSCNGSQGSVTINGLAPGSSYQLSYTDDGIDVGPTVYVANGAGQVIVSGLNAGLYSDFVLEINGCATNLSTGIILSNPIFVPKFSAIAAFCAGTSPPTLPSTSTNGITGTWSPAMVDNQNSATYTFTPTSGQCGISTTLKVNVIPRTIPTFTFGTALSICANGVVPVLPNISTNGVSGTWTPSVVDKQNSGTYIFNPSAGQCAKNTSFTVTISPNVTPTFAFGSTLTICAGDVVTDLPATSVNGITGTWSPSVIDNRNSGSYSFNPAAGQCATTSGLTVTVNPIVTPTFSFGMSLTLCAGNTVPALPTTSLEGISGTWSPSVVDNQNAGIYTFTPIGSCNRSTTFSVTVNPVVTPTFSFGNSLAVCAGNPVPSLPVNSMNGITGTWSPSAIDNQTSATYTFNPGAGSCASSITLSVSVNANITPTFNFGNSLVICVGDVVPPLPTSSSNGIPGTWTPSSINNQSSGTYTFTPQSGNCATSNTLTVTVNPIVTPTFAFGTSLTICSGAAVPTLPTTSGNGISGTWSPALVSNQNSASYIFTPAAGMCAPAISFSVTVNPLVTPTFSFGNNLAVCAGDPVPSLPVNSMNGITGTWSPSVIDNQTSATYTFNPGAGTCASSITLSVSVNANITPTFNFGNNLIICAGDVVPALPTTSSNGIPGTWTPSSINNQSSGTYTFTPQSGYCATSNTLTVTVNPIVTPTFAFGTSLSICSGATVPTLPTTSENGISGTWSPAIVSNQNSASYIFTPATGVCAPAISFSVTITQKIVPTFTFGTSLQLCVGAASPALPAISENGISGTWSPGVIDNQNSGTYTFTPSAGQCAAATTLSITVSAKVMPVFPFGSSVTICAGGNLPVLPARSTNGITGTWSPAVPDNQRSGTYTFTPAATECATPTSFSVTVNNNTTPSFSFGSTLTICAGGVVPALTTTSDNGISGTWSPGVVSNQSSATYTFSPTSGQCILGFTFTVTVNPLITPTFTFGTFESICKSSSVPTLPVISANGIRGSWNPALVDNQVNGQYTFTPDNGQCANGATYTLEVNDIPTVNTRTDTSIYDGMLMPGVNLDTYPAGSVAWTNSNPGIGLAASGNGHIPSFIAVNRTDNPIIATVTISPYINGCIGTAKRYLVTVLPLNKDVYIPNVFSPNNDGKNDFLLVYGNYISKIEMRIFNQWGQQIALIDDPRKGWDGRHRGAPQPVGVYVYICKAILTDGKVVNLKGSVTIVR